MTSARRYVRRRCLQVIDQPLPRLSTSVIATANAQPLANRARDFLECASRFRM